MKKILSALIVFSAFIIFAGCSKKEEAKPETFSAEAFAYDMENAWEINSSIRVKGFEQAEDGGGFRHSLAYSVSLVTPSGEIISDLDKGNIKDAPKEKVTDLGIEIQYELDKAKGSGKYKIVYDIRDELSGKSVKGEKEFEVM